MKKQRRNIAGLLIISIILSMLMVGGCSKRYTSPKNDSKSLVVTIGKDKIYMEAIKPFIAKTEITTEYYNQMYKQMYMQTNPDYNIWDEKDSDDVINAISLRDKVLEEFEERYICYKEANKSGDKKYTISEADLKKLKKNSKELVKTFSKNVIRKTGFKEDSFVELQKMEYVYNKYKEDIIKTFKVTKKDVEKDYDFDNVYRQYKTTQLYISTSTTDDAGNTTELSDAEKKTAKATLEKAYKLLKQGKTVEQIQKKYSTVLSEEKSYQQDEAYPAEEKSKDKDSKTAEDDEKDIYVEKTKKLKNKEFTKVFEYDGKYCIGIMDNNKSKEAYENAIDNGISKLEEEKFADKIKEFKKTDDYKITVNKKVWDSIRLGNVTIIQDEFLKASGILENKKDKQ